MLAPRVAQTNGQPVLMHPNIGAVYREQVAELCEALTDPQHRGRAVEVMRRLIDGIELTPVEEGGKTVLVARLCGKLAALPAMGAGAREPLNGSGLEMRVTKLVAGTRPRSSTTARPSRSSANPASDGREVVPG